VKFYDLKVDTPAGVQTLYSRIHAAAQHVCEYNDAVMPLGVIVCVNRAEARAIQTLNLPQLTAYYREKNGSRSRLIAKR
jgi:UrcA family protein